jgi:hypothetical protein
MFMNVNMNVNVNKTLVCSEMKHVLLAANKSFIYIYIHIYIHKHSISRFFTFTINLVTQHFENKHNTLGKIYLVP